MLGDILSTLSRTITTKPLPKNGKINSYTLQIDGKKLTDLLASHIPYYYQHSNLEEILSLGVLQYIKHQGPNRFFKIKQSIKELSDRMCDLSTIEKPVWVSQRIFGGFTFFDHEQEGIWKDFTSILFVFPLLQILKRDLTSYITVNWSSKEDIDKLEEIFDHIKSSTNNYSDEIKIESINYPISRNEWVQTINEAKVKMNDQLRKVVLSRICKIRSKDPIKITPILDKLRNSYPECNIFSFQPIKDIRFFGATPEILCKVENGHLETMALAGTSSRSNNELEDNKIGEELLTNSKEKHEHDIVVDTIIEELGKLVSNITYESNPKLLKLRNVQHLLTQIQGDLDASADIIDIIELLHPTAALGGKPKKVAMNFIKANEEISRGMYGAPIGWIDMEWNGLFVIAIRSSIASSYEFWLYAGAGIVSESDPEMEWQETELKFKPIMDAIGVE